jgi:anti-anti-sigma factor
MTASISQRVPPSVSDLYEAAIGGGAARPYAGVAAHDDHVAECTADLPVGSHFIAGLPRDDAARLPGLSITDHGGAAVVSMRGELDISVASALQAYLSDIRRQARPRSVADLTGLAFIDCACLGVLVRHCKEVRRQGGRFVLAGPQPGVRRILAITGLLTWFEVHDTVEEANHPRTVPGYHRYTARAGARRGSKKGGRRSLRACGSDGVLDMVTHLKPLSRPVTARILSTAPRGPASAKLQPRPRLSSQQPTSTLRQAQAMKARPVRSTAKRLPPSAPRAWACARRSTPSNWPDRTA